METGFYNVKGLMRRLTELTAESRRYLRPLACVVVGPRDDTASQSILREILSAGADEGESRSANGDAGATPAALPAMVASLARVTRLSDAKGLLGDQHFVILAPDTDLKGAQRLAERVLDGYNQAGESREPICIGLYATEHGDEDDPPRPGELLTRATTAFRRAQNQSGVENRIERYDG
jgi:GGDEF domain-containing protein